jgi:hypothetical protein
MPRPWIAELEPGGGALIIMEEAFTLMEGRL